MYVTYDFYSKTFGSLIPEDDFPKIGAEAEAAISYLTYVNGDIFAKEDSRVKLAVCAAAEVIYNSKQNNGTSRSAGIKSESNDGYSVTYVTEAALRKKVAEAVRLYLLPTGWLSRKVGCCHVCASHDHSLQ